MTISTRLVATALASTLITVTPAFAQHRSSGGRGHSASSGGQARGGAVVRSGSRPVASGGHVYAQSRGTSGDAPITPGPRRSGSIARTTRSGHASILGLACGSATQWRTRPLSTPPTTHIRTTTRTTTALRIRIPIRTRTTNPYPYGGPAYGGPAPAYPPNAYPPNAYPPNAYPPNGYPPNGVSTQHHAATRRYNSADQVFESVIESKLPGEPIGECRRPA